MPAWMTFVTLSCHAAYCWQTPARRINRCVLPARPKGRHQYAPLTSTPHHMHGGCPSGRTPSLPLHRNPVLAPGPFLCYPTPQAAHLAPPTLPSALSHSFVPHAPGGTHALLKSFLPAKCGVTTSFVDITDLRAVERELAAHPNTRVRR